jgi:agarase
MAFPANFSGIGRMGCARPQIFDQDQEVSVRFAENGSRWLNHSERSEAATPARGFFRAAQPDGAWWLVDPEGGRSISKGVDTVRFEQDYIQNTMHAPYADACERKYGGKDAWRAAVAQRLLSWGFNTLGAWSDEAVAHAALSRPPAGAAPSRLAVAPNLNLGADFGWGQLAAEPGEAFPDVFHSDFEPRVRRRAHELCAPSRDDPGLIGWFIDNELRWGPDWRGKEELLTTFLNLSGASAGRQAAIQILRERYGTFAAFNDVWRTAAGCWDELAMLTRVVAPYDRNLVYARNEGAERQSNTADPRRAAFAADCEAFVNRLAERYFEITASAIRAADPNHMVLGCRFAYVPERGVIDAAGRHVDVISFNCYERDPLAAIMAYAPTGKPCMIGEFSFRSDDPGLPNTIGAAPRVATQAERARCFRSYVTAALPQPTLVGYHWFEHADQPLEGRFDGENSNYGTVTIDDDVYAELTQTMAAVNGEAEQIHGFAARLAA